MVGKAQYKSTKQGQTKHPDYRLWSGMKDRCSSQTGDHYKRYAGRGIKVCDRWLGRDGFFNFTKDMGLRPLGYTLDRIDNDGDYSPDNCRWATPTQQQRNKSVRGVSFDKARKKWKATIRTNDKRLYLGRFNSINDALKAREVAIATYWE